MIKVRCYGGPAHGRTINLDDMASYRFEMYASPRFNHLLEGYSPLGGMLPPSCNLREIHTYYLQTYQQEGITECESGVHRRAQVTILEGAELLRRELHELEDAMESVPWTWSQRPFDPSPVRGVVGESSPRPRLGKSKSILLTPIGVC